MEKLCFVVILLLMLAGVPGCRFEQPLVLQVYRDRTSSIGRELDRRFYELSAERISLPSGRKITFSTIEPKDYLQMLRDRIGKELLPELIVLDSPSDAAGNPIIEREAAHAVNICAAVHACPAAVPAFIPS
jgi:hypothetical protein